MIEQRIQLAPNLVAVRELHLDQCSCLDGLEVTDLRIEDEAGNEMDVHVDLVDLLWDARQFGGRQYWVEASRDAEESIDVDDHLVKTGVGPAYRVEDALIVDRDYAAYQLRKVGS